MPGVIIEGAVKIGPRCSVMFGAVLRAEEDEIVVGEETNIQDRVIVHCDLGFPALIGERVTIGHGAIVHGATVGDRCLVGIGGIVLSGAVMGEGSWLAAGSLLPEGKSLDPYTLGMGVPARSVRELTSHEIARQVRGVEEYLKLGPLYRSRYSED